MGRLSTSAEDKYVLSKAVHNRLLAHRTVPSKKRRLNPIVELLNTIQIIPMKAADSLFAANNTEKTKASQNRFKSEANTPRVSANKSSASLVSSVYQLKLTITDRARSVEAKR